MTVKEQLIFFSNHGISISYIANLIQVDPSTLTKWINGQKGITHKNEEKIHIALQNLVKELTNIME